MTRIYLICILVIVTSCSVLAQKQSNKYQLQSSGGLWVGAMVGPSLLIEKAADSLPAGIQDYFNQLRSGWHYGFETEYFLNNYFGIGAKYTRFNTKQEADSIVIEFFSSTFYIDLSNNMSIHAFSPMVYGRLPLLNNKLSVTGGLGPAWLFYRNLGTAVSDSVMIKGSSPGLSTSLRVSYEVIPNLRIGLQGNYIYSILKGFTQDDGSATQEITLEEENYQNISRLDISFGIFYTFHRNLRNK